MNIKLKKICNYKLNAVKVTDIERTVNKNYEFSVSDRFDDDFTFTLTEEEYNEVFMKKLTIHSCNKIDCNTKDTIILDYLDFNRLDFYFKIEAIDNSDSVHCILKNVEFTPENLIQADKVPKEINDLDKLDFLIMDNGFGERNTYMLADLIGIQGNGENMVTFYFKVSYVVDQDDGTVYRDVLYTETLTVEKLRELFEDYIESGDADSILEYIGRSFILYIEYRFTEPSSGEFVTTIWTDKLILL